MEMAAERVSDVCQSWGKSLPIAGLLSKCLKCFPKFEYLLCQVWDPSELHALLLPAVHPQVEAGQAVRAQDHTRLPRVQADLRLYLPQQILGRDYRGEGKTADRLQGRF